MHHDAPIFCHYDSYRYSKPNVSGFTGNYIRRYSWTGLIETYTFFSSDWWKYSDITQQHHVLVEPSTVLVVGTPSTGVAGCARCSWSQVCLLPCYSWYPSGILLCLDTYRDTYCIVTLYRNTNRIVRHPYCYTPTYCDVTQCMNGLRIFITKLESPKGDSQT